MAIDKSAINNQDIDLDDVEVVILIVAKSPAKIGQAANFLTRRGWPTTTMTNLSQAIEFSTDRKPDFVLISINHPNPAISKFSELLTTTFGTTCVAFAENMDTASSARLAKSPLAAKIQGQASGPNLHRSLRKLLAEKLNIQLDDRGGQDKERGTSYEKNISVKGGTGADGPTIVQKSDGIMQNKGPTMIKGESLGDAQGGQFENESVSNGKYTMAKKARRSLKDLAKHNSEQSNGVDKPDDLAARLKKSLFGDDYKGEPEVVALENEDGAEGDSRDGAGTNEDFFAPNEGEEGQADGPASSRQSNGIYTPSTSSQLQNSPAPGAMVGNMAGASGGNGYQPDHADGGSHSNAMSSSNSGAEAASGSMSNADAGKNGGDVPGKINHANGSNTSELQTGNAANTSVLGNEKKSLESVGPHSLIERAVQTALAKICRPATGKHDPISMIEQVGVFPIDSPSLPGYLVLAWPHEEMRAIEPFFKQAQHIISTTFNEMGVQAKLEPGFFVTLPQVEFPLWASENATFSFSTAHGNEEIGVAFFETQKPIPKPKQVEDKTMYLIDLESISTETPVNFKVYLHMKKNKKYFLYLRNGRQLQPEQKERLEGRKVTDLYMKSIDVENLRMFLATCHLRNKIKKAG